VVSAAEITRGVRGALGFLRRDPTAGARFDNTMEACLRSFWVMVLVAPLYAIYCAIKYSSHPTTSDEFEIFVVESLYYVVAWLIYPVIFYEAAHRRGWLARYPRYIGALNWINLPVTVMQVVLAVATPGALADVITLVVYGYWFLMTTRMLVGVNWLIAIVLLIVNVMPSLFLSLIVDRILGVVTVTAV
jgi:hypothetical protein